MLNVELNHILSESDALSRIQELFSQVELQGETYVITKDGKPALALVNVNNLESQLSTPSSPAPVTQPLEPVPFSLPESLMPTAPQEPVAVATPQLPPLTPPVTAPITPSEAQVQAPAPPPPTVNQPPTQPETYQQGVPALPDMPAEDLDNDSPLA